MQCEMCGRKAAEAVGSVEGTELRLCADCTKYGKDVRELQIPVPENIKKKAAAAAVTAQAAAQQKAVKAEQKKFVITEGYASIVRNSRQKAGLTQKVLAAKIAEKETIIHKIETGHDAPSIALARKLEKFFGIRLIEIVTDGVYSQKGHNPALTVGDIMKLRDRKKGI
jgi:putative transcription factor